MKYFFSFLVLAIFFGCSGGDAKTEGRVVSSDNYDKRAVIYINETRNQETY